MKNTVLLFVMFVILGAISAPLTPQRRAEIMALRAKRLAEAGGIVTKPHSGNYARIVSAQNVVSVEYVKEVTHQFNTGLNIWIEVSELAPEKTPMQTLARAKQLPNTGILLVIVEDENSPTILAAMEDGWSILNVKKLSEDLPPQEVLNLRIRKEINRAFAQAFGAGLSMNKPCVMEPVYKLSDLDSIKFPVISPEAMNKIMDACYKRNIPPISRTTYLKACEQGWAPAPTNDVQKAIWDKVHATPKNPMKIEFDPKKGR